MPRQTIIQAEQDCPLHDNRHYAATGCPSCEAAYSALLEVLLELDQVRPVLTIENQYILADKIIAALAAKGVLHVRKEEVAKGRHAEG